MAWSPLTMGISQGKDESMNIFSRSSFKNKYSSFSWTEDETAAANKEVRRRAGGTSIKNGYFSNFASKLLFKIA